MPPKKNSSTARRQLSVETVPTHSDPDLDSDDDFEGGFDPVQAATEMKRVIEGHKKRRFAARKKIEAKYEARVAEIVKRTEKRLEEQDRNMIASRKDQLDRLTAAVEARDAKQRAVAEQLGRFYDSCVSLNSLLENVYAGLAREARSAVLTEE